MSTTRTIVGLDFGTYSIKAVWLEKRADGVSVQKTEELQVPPETQDPIRFIQPWLEKHGLQKTLSSAAIPGTQTVFQPVVLPAEDPRSVTEAADNEVASFSEMAGETMKYGVSSMSLEDGARLLQIALVRPNVVESGLRGGTAFSLRLCDLVPSPVAVFNGAVSNAVDSERPTLFVSMGHQTTDLAIGSSQGLLFARSFAIGGKAFTDAIARAKGVSDLQAERIKKTEGNLAEGTPWAEVLRSVATLWCSQIRSALSVYRGQFQNPKIHPTRIVFLGGGVQLEGFQAYATETLAMVSEPTSMGLRISPVPPVFATAYGLALSGAGIGVSGISLFPEYLKNEIIFREKKPYWIAAGVFAALILGTFIAVAGRSISRERKNVSVETERIKKLEKMDNNVQRMHEEIAVLRSTADPVRKLLEGGPQARELVRLLAGAIHPEDWITMVSDEDLYIASEMPVEEKEPAKGAAPKATPRKTMGSIMPLRIGAKPKKPTGPSAAPAKPAKGGKRTGKTQTVAETAATLAPTFSVFIVEGYTPQTDLSTVKQLIENLVKAPMIQRADVLASDLVLPAIPLGDDSTAETIVGKYSRFVLRVELKPMTVEEVLSK